MTMIAFSNQKGGVGKTSLCWNTAVFLANKYGKKVLVVDLDTQGTISTTLAGVYDDEGVLVSPRINSDCLNTPELFKKDLQKSKDYKILKSSHNIDLIFNQTYTVELFVYMYQPPCEEVNVTGQVNCFINNLKMIANDYDYVLLDCPPAYGHYITAALYASDYVLAPIKPISMNLLGAKSLYDLVSIQKNPKKFLGLVFNYINKSWPRDLNYVQSLRDSYGDLIFKSVIYQRAPFNYSIESNTPLYKHPQWRTSALEVEGFVKELIERIDIRENKTTPLNSLF